MVVCVRLVLGWLLLVVWFFFCVCGVVSLGLVGGLVSLVVCWGGWVLG